MTAMSALGKLGWPMGLAQDFKLQEFWEKRLPSKEGSVWFEGSNSLGELAYRQLQRLVAQQTLAESSELKPKSGSGRLKSW
jgi:hypothetical protein